MPLITSTRVNDFVTLTLTGPRLSALDVAILDELRSAVDQARSSRGILITGTGRAFSAGVDLSQLVEGGRGYAEELLMAMSRTYTELFDLPIPVVAAVNGHAIAGGCVLALTADHRVGSTGKIGLNESAIGLPFPPAALGVAHHALGTRAPGIILQGGLHDTEDALPLGLLDEVAERDHVVAAASARLARLGQIPPATFARTKLSLRAPVRARWAVDRQEIAGLADEWTTPEMLARVASVLGK